MFNKYLNSFVKFTFIFNAIFFFETIETERKIYTELKTKYFVFCLKKYVEKIKCKIVNAKQRQRAHAFVSS